MMFVDTMILLRSSEQASRIYELCSNKREYIDFCYYTSMHTQTKPIDFGRHMHKILLYDKIHESNFIWQTYVA